MADRTGVVPVERIESRIFLLRGHKVMLSSDLATLYGVQARALIQAVRRNRDRFPPDFMFQLTAGESANLKSQIVTSSWGGVRRATPMPSRSRGSPCCRASCAVAGRSS
ncbi:ORF6N domain-containing protein [Nitrospira sp. Kam-Ns4a]